MLAKMLSAARARLTCVTAASCLVVAAWCGGLANAAETRIADPWAGGEIAAGSTVIIDDGGSITGSVTVDGTLRFNQTTDLTVGSLITGTGSLVLANTGTVALTGLTENFVNFDMAVTVADGRMLIGSTGTSNVAVGRTGTGELFVTGGVVNSWTSYLGFDAGSRGTATVTSGSWASARVLYVGLSGTGELEVAGGRVSNTNGIIGDPAGGVGSVVVSSGTWAINSQLSVGGYGISGTGAGTGTGSLRITGGSVTNNVGSIGFNAGSLGVATVTGGEWANRGALFVARSGTGTLEVTGGLVTSASGTIASGTGSAGLAVITGGTWQSAGSLTVGVEGSGTLSISGSHGTGGVVIVGGTLSRGAQGTINLAAGGTLQIGTGSASGVLATDLVNHGQVVFNRSGSTTLGHTISGSGAVRLTGSGTFTVSGTNDYTGPTTIDNATLLVAGGLGMTDVTVNVGGRLGGSGTIDGSVTVTAAGVLAPGASIESLATGAVTLLDGATFAAEWDSSAPLSSGADLLRVAGDLTLVGSVGLSLEDLAAIPARLAEGTTFSLIAYSGSWNEGRFSLDGRELEDGMLFWADHQPWTIHYAASIGGLNVGGESLSGGSFVNLVAVPEPSTMGLLAAGALGIWVWRRSGRPRAG
jgi:T5SS/PEP-CTERM-associated repeat protein/autotransporter-associated beta strand protein